MSAPCLVQVIHQPCDLSLAAGIVRHGCADPCNVQAVPRPATAGRHKVYIIIRRGYMLQFRCYGIKVKALHSAVKLEHLSVRALPRVRKNQ